MRRKTLLMTLLMLIGFSMANAIEVEVGTMETNKLTNQFPTNPFFAYSLSQQIYNALELGMTSGAITSISFYRDWTSENIDELSMSGLKLYMKHTDKSGFDSDTDMIPVEESDLVWTGTLSAPTVDYKGWVTINLDKPFQYDGYNNLVVCFYDTNPAKTTANTNKFYYNASGVNAALTYFSNDVMPDLENINSFSGNKVAMAAHNWMKLTINNYAKIDVLDNTATDYFPFWSYWKYSLTQQIYTSEELGESKTIKSISFYNTGTGGDKTRKIELYLMHTDNPNFLVPYYNLVNYTDADKVFDGEVTFVSGEWTTASTTLLSPWRIILVLTLGELPSSHILLEIIMVFTIFLMLTQSPCPTVDLSLVSKATRRTRFASTKDQFSERLQTLLCLPLQAADSPFRSSSTRRAS